MSEAGPHRILRVIVDARKAEWDVMASIGHELRHTIEVLGERRVRSSVAMYNFYAREGTPGTIRGTFETDAAIDAGRNVLAEVRQYQRRREGFNPGAH